MAAETKNSKGKEREANQGERMSLDVLKGDPVNPRDIEGKALDGLGVSLETFGDLAGIVFNLTTGELVAGHQRMKKLRAEGLTEWFRGGDSAWLFHPKTGERFEIRLVEWDKTKQRLANLTANNPRIQGDFTEEALAQLREIDPAELKGPLLDGLLEDLTAEFDPAEDEPADDDKTGEDETDRTQTGFMVIVECTDETHQTTLIQRFEKEGLKCRALI